jgi:hypothetical protein
LLDGGHVLIHEFLLTAQAANALEEMPEAMGGGDVIRNGHVLVIPQQFGQAEDVDAGDILI